MAIVEKVPCANKLNGARLVSCVTIGLTVCADGPPCIPFNLARAPTSTPSIVSGSVLEKLVESVGSLARKMNITASHMPTISSVLM